MAKQRDAWRDIETFFRAVGTIIEQSDQREWPEAAFVQLMTRQHPISKSFHRWLAACKHEGWLKLSRETRTLAVEVREGRLRLNNKGFGFVVSEAHPGDDAFVPERRLHGARHDDVVRVWVRANEEGPGPEGMVLGVVERSTERVIGQLVHQLRQWTVIADDRRLPDVHVPRPEHAAAGDLVVAAISEWPLDATAPAVGSVVERIGKIGEPGMDIAALIAAKHLPFGFPLAVLHEAEALPDTVEPEQLLGRLDLRDQFVVTIDGSDAKDLDDAISIEASDDGWRVGVHIADVSYYVREGSALDREARARGTSVYLVDRVIPMLPERLSNGIASLNPGVPRLTVSAFMDLDASGNVIKTEFARSLIQTRHRLTYEGVNQILETKPASDPRLLGFLQQAHRVRDVRYQRRSKRGAVDFDLPEPKVILDAAGHVEQIAVRQHGMAESIIEECMLLANEAVAAKLLQAKLPGMFRVHEPPLAEKIEQFREMVGVLGYRLPKTATPKSLQSILHKAKNTPEERVISSALLRSMRQARYSDQNLGHFGLASDEYTHFTSPIRRYPDLYVHRVLTTFLAGSLEPEIKAKMQREAPEVAELASRRERDAMEAERESVLIKEVEFMADKIGEEFVGIVSGVTGFGLFVELPNLIEGLVRVEDLPSDYWAFDRVHYRLSGKRTGKSYRIGDTLSVVVARVDTHLRRIDLMLQEARSVRASVRQKSARKPTTGPSRMPVEASPRPGSAAASTKRPKRRARRRRGTKSSLNK